MYVYYRFTPVLQVVNMLGSKEEREEKRLNIIEQMVSDYYTHYTRFKMVVSHQ